MSAQKRLERPDSGAFAERARGAFLGLVAADREWHPRPGPPGYGGSFPIEPFPPFERSARNARPTNGAMPQSGYAISETARIKHPPKTTQSAVRCC